MRSQLHDLSDPERGQEFNRDVHDDRHVPQRLQVGELPPVRHSRRSDLQVE